MSSIRIIDTPKGNIPLWVREEWNGVVIPLFREINAFSYQVNTRKAIEELEKKSPEAANWWRKHVDFDVQLNLLFSKDDCELVD